MPVKVIIVEDNPYERLILAKGLNAIAEIEIVAQAATGIEAINIIETSRPDVVFLDMDLPAKHGVEIAQEIAEIDPQIFIVFATGYPSYMGEAFEVYAFDYLLKPYNMERLRQTMERIKKLIAQRQQAVIPRGSGTSVKHRTHRKIEIKTDQGWAFVNTDDILVVTRAGRKTKIATRKGEILTNEQLTEVETRLGGSPFFRCHKGYIINLDYVAGMSPWGRSTYVINLEGTTETALATLDKARGIKARLPIAKISKR